MECIKDFYLHNFKFKKSDEFDESVLTSGISLYEVIKIENRIPIFLEDHLNRLFESADISYLQINESYCDIESLILELIKKNDADKGKIKIIIHFNENSKSEEDLLIYFTPHIIPSKENYENGIVAGICDAVRLNPNAKIYNTDARKKANVKILQEKLFEVLLVDKEGFITEGSRSNVFFIQDHKVLTPPNKDVLNGITRKHIIDICLKNNIPIIEQKINYSEIPQIDAIFFTGTSIDVLPVKTIEKNVFSTNNTLLKQIMDLYKQLISDYIASKKLT
jgi:branched-chain amino acid aminotransferase